MRLRLEDLIALAYDAAREILAVREEGFETLKKADKSPVTVADQRAEAVIEAGLARLAPNIPMIGEEAVSAGRVPETDSQFFCVDPLDGTRDFVAGTDEFTVNIGLVENRLPVAGVVLIPASGEVFAASEGRAVKGVYDMKRGVLLAPPTPIRAATSKPLEGYRMFVSRRSGKTSRNTRFSELIGDGPRFSASSSIKFCRLAEGAADLYPRFGDMNEWDACAGHAVLAAAGGGVMRLDGSPLTYGARDGMFLIHGLVAYANDEAARAAREALRVIGEAR